MEEYSYHYVVKQDGSNELYRAQYLYIYVYTHTHTHTHTHYMLHMLIEDLNCICQCYKTIQKTN